MNSSKTGIICFFGVLFLIFLLLNRMTPYIADDYAYMYSFDNAAPLSNVIDVIKSMRAHAYVMNGRVIPHGLEQLFFLAPKIVFNVINSLVLTVMLYLIYRICNFGKERNLALYAVIAMAYWCFMPAFGQVSLWQVGALNYGWALTAGTVFIIPFLIHFLTPDRNFGMSFKLCFTLCAFVFGMYTEITSFICIFAAFALIVLSRVIKKQRLGTWLFAPLITAAAGYAALLLMPSELAAKGGKDGLRGLIIGLVTVLRLLISELLPLILIWACLFVIALLKRAGYERVVISGLFAFSGAASALMLCAASYVPERCLCTAALFFIAAVSVLLPDLIKSMKIVAGCLGGVLAVVFLFSFIEGTTDIIDTYTAFSEREAFIKNAVANGEKELVLQCVKPKTKYSAFWGISDLNTQSADEYPNVPMAMYYGLDSIIGVDDI